MNIPENLHYTKDHEWLKAEGNIATIGITDFAQGELGDIVFIDIGSVGKTLAAGEIFGTIEAVKTVSDLFMPVSGKVIEVNPALDKNPESVNKDVYGNGWMIRIELSDASQVNSMLSAEDYKKHVGA